MNEIKYVQGNYIEKDIKRLKKIKSLEEDLKNHHKIFKGYIEEQMINKYNVPLVSAMLYEIEINEEVSICFYKDRCATRNPKMSPGEGLRIVFALYLKKNIAIQYTPFIVFMANEEKDKYNAPDGKQYPLTASYFSKIIEAKLDNIEN